MAQMSFLDNLLTEYLVFRGFTNTLKAFDAERKSEKGQVICADKMMEQLNQAIHSQDLINLLTQWKHLDTQLFNKLDHTHAAGVKKLENSLLKFYLVVAYNNNKTDKITEFFNKLSLELQQQSEWKEWFYFPFCHNPAEHPLFAMYFTKQWQETFQLSLRNFLATIYQCLPKPTFVHAEQEATIVRHLQEENALLKYRIQQQQIALQNIKYSNNTTANDKCKQQQQHSLYRFHNLDDIIPFDINPPGHVFDDFYIIASEVSNITQASNTQSRGLKTLIRNIGGSISEFPTVNQQQDQSNGKYTKRLSTSVSRS